MLDFCLRRKGTWTCIRKLSRGPITATSLKYLELMRWRHRERSPAHRPETRGAMMIPTQNLGATIITDPRALGCSRALGAGCMSSNWTWSTESIGIRLPGEVKGITQRRWWVTDEVSVSVKEISRWYLLFLRMYSSRKKKKKSTVDILYFSGCDDCMHCIISLLQLLLWDDGEERQ